MADFIKMAVDRIPLDIQKKIVNEGLIDKAFNMIECKELEYLFDVYEEYIDLAGELDDWTCYTCRQKVLTYFHQFKPYLWQANKTS